VSKRNRTAPKLHRSLPLNASSASLARRNAGLQNNDKSSPLNIDATRHSGRRSTGISAKIIGTIKAPAAIDFMVFSSFRETCVDSFPQPHGRSLDLRRAYDALLDHGGDDAAHPDRTRPRVRQRTDLRFTAQRRRGVDIHNRPNLSHGR
jgi:hypothetical protein